MNTKEKVSCIIPAYNEEKTIRGVIKVCLKTPEIDDIVVVNDGSVDKTAEVARKIGDNRLKVISYKENRGKGFAVAEGLKLIKNNTVLLLDADLINLKPHFLSSLIWPVLLGRVDMTIATWYYRNFDSFFWRVSGQRCLKVDFLKYYLKDIRRSKYGLEILLNEIFSDKRVVVVPWVTEKRLHLMKREKDVDGWLTSYVKESFDVVKTFLKNRTKSYREKFIENWTKEMSFYLQVRVKKIKSILGL